ncbi:hypothetical protein M408DRAFT_19298 [Serendipita vermifera MAFF 305830]|uniref:PHD-type domain-containing protein n=1 Tax=Serendipita vermifera MAFF 305830 TaxID=933852 RepID=A0A0C3BC28_SERVB|nr:hypothetical protein M408DRAFT_19298 [Serendipita vermifera MAFF 305830]
MEQVTPPQRTSRLAEIPSSEHGNLISTPTSILNTPTPRLEPASRKLLWSDAEDLRPIAAPDFSSRRLDGTIPSTPLTSLESNDGSSIKTPFGNIGLWNAGSPGIADTPTPAGSHTVRNMGRDTLPPIQINPDAVTPQFPSNPAQFGLHIGGPESPLKRKESAATTALRKPHSDSKLDSRSISSDEVPVEMPEFRLEVSQDGDEEVNEDTSMDTSDTLQKQDIEPAMSDSVALDTSASSEELESVRSSRAFQPRTPPSIPQSIQRWLGTASVKRSESHGSSRPIREKESSEKTRQRLAQFTRVQNKSTPMVDAYVHEHAGRILHPHAHESEHYGIPALNECPDDVYPWSLARPDGDTDHARTRLRKLEMIERYLEEETSSEDDNSPKTDPADAMVALRAKKASRNLIQKRKEATKVATKATSASTPHAPAKKPSKAVLATPPKVEITPESEMDIDKDSDEVACICKGPDDGRPMIQCDNCHSWLHVDCVTREEERNRLPDKWYCWKCPVGTAPDRVSTDAQPVFVASSTPEYPKNLRRDTAADIPIYQASDKQQASPELGAYAPGAETPSSSALLAERTPQVNKDWPKYPFSVDDPMTAIAATPFIGSSFQSPYGTFDDSFDHLQSPNRNFGLQYAPPPSATPRRERPWTNYIGSFAAPTNPTGPQLSPSSAQALPIVQTDPLFIHYEHDAPKQTAHHHGRAKKKAKPKEKGTDGSEKGDETATAPPDSAESSNAEESGPFSDPGTVDASTPTESHD